MMKKNGGNMGFGKNTDTVIGADIILEKATLKGGGVVRIDGQFSGTIDIQGHIAIGETGEVEGDMHAESALIAGKYRGNLNIQEVLHVTSTAALSGRVESGKLIVDEGAVFNEVTTVSKPESAASKAKTDDSSGNPKPDKASGKSKTEDIFGNPKPDKASGKSKTEDIFGNPKPDKAFGKSKKDDIFG